MRPPPIPAPIGGAAELRAWARWARKVRHSTGRWRVRVALESLLRPATVARQALQGTQRYDGDARGLRRLRRLSDVYVLGLRYQLEPTSYFRFQLFRAERRRRAPEYVEARLYGGLMRRYLSDLPREDRAIFVDKRHFAEWAAREGLPSIATLLVLDPARLPAPEEAMRALTETDLFSKPLDMQGGKGAARWTHVAPGRWRGVDGVERDARAMVAELFARATALRHRLIVQEALRTHPALQQFTRLGLCTVRLVTARPVGGGAPRLLHALLRMPVGDSAADNFDAGGVAVPIDVDRGTLGVGVRKDPRQLAAPVESHPTTGARIVGQAIPEWEAACRLALHAHTLTPPTIPLVGWDVAVTDRGLVLVEANNVPDLNILQMPSDEPMGDSPFIATLLEHVRAFYGARAARG